MLLGQYSAPKNTVPFTGIRSCLNGAQARLWQRPSAHTTLLLPELSNPERGEASPKWDIPACQSHPTVSKWWHPVRCTSCHLAMWLRGRGNEFFSVLISSTFPFLRPKTSPLSQPSRIPLVTPRQWESQLQQMCKQQSYRFTRLKQRKKRVQHLFLQTGHSRLC